MLPYEVPRLTTDSPVRVFPGVLKLLSFLRLASQYGSLSLSTLSLFLSFTFFPTFFWIQWAAFLGAWCPLPEFRSCFVAFTQHSNVLLMNFFGQKVVSLSYSSAILGVPSKLLLLPMKSIGPWRQYCLPMGNSYGEGDGTPLQYSCLENPMDGGAW